jgi:hypothetical protein
MEPQSRISINGQCHQLAESYQSQAVYSPCPAPPPNAAAVVGFSTIAALAVLTVAWVIPEITHRKTQYRSVILNAKRSL